jgi:hypothetical protein
METNRYLFRSLAVGMSNFSVKQRAHLALISLYYIASSLCKIIPLNRYIPCAVFLLARLLFCFFKRKMKTPIPMSVIAATEIPSVTGSKLRCEPPEVAGLFELVAITEDVCDVSVIETI